MLCFSQNSLRNQHWRTLGNSSTFSFPLLFVFYQQNPGKLKAFFPFTGLGWKSCKICWGLGRHLHLGTWTFLLTEIFGPKSLCANWKVGSGFPGTLYTHTTSLLTGSKRGGGGDTNFKSSQQVLIECLLCARHRCWTPGYFRYLQGVFNWIKGPDTTSFPFHPWSTLL